MGTEALLPGGKSPSTKASAAEEQMAKQLNLEASPVRGEVFGQIINALQGGVNSPVSVRAQQGAVQGAQESRRELDERIGQAELPDPFATTLRRQEQMRGQTSYLGVPAQISQDYLGIAPGLTSGSGANAIQGLSAATSSEASVRSGQIAAVSQILTAALGSGLSSGDVQKAVA